MRRRDWLGLGVALALALGVAIFGVRVARHFPALRWEVGREALTRLEPATLERLESLQDRVFITYYVTRRDRMPSHLKRLEREVTDFLEALRGASQGLVDFQIIDPGDSEDLAGYAAKRHVSPFRTRSVERDAYSEEVVRSTLTIAYGHHPPAEIHGVVPEHLPRLQELVVRHLDQMDAPRRPVVAIAPATGFETFAASVAERAEVLRLNLDGGEPIPDAADALFWLDPGQVVPERLRQLELFLEKGRGVVLAGSKWDVEVGGFEGEAAMSLDPTGYPAEELLGELGLRPRDQLVLDQFGGAFRFGEEEVPAPFMVRCIAPNQDFHNLINQPNGNLLFSVPTTFTIDSERLAERGWSAEVLATTSDKTWLQPLPDGPLPTRLIAPERGEPAPKLPLLVHLVPDDPWQGSIFAAAAATPFEEGFFDAPNVAHWRLARTLLDNLLTDERLVVGRLGAHRPEPLPPLEPDQRALWRALCVGLPALLLAALALLRGAFRTRGPASLRRGRGAVLRPAALVLAGLVAVLALVAGARALHLEADLTAEGLNSLAPESQAIAGRAEGLEAELFFSPPGRMPADKRLYEQHLRDALRRFERAGAELELRVRRPETLAAAELEELAAAGIGPFKDTSQSDEVTTVRTLWACLRLRRAGPEGERVELLRFEDALSQESLEFRLAFALWRLETGRRPRIAFATDIPRPSAAEAYEYYQQQGLFSPMGTNVNSLAGDLLEDAGFEVAYINQRRPEWPGGEIDLFLWMQPRRDIGTLLDMATEYLHAGGNLLLAAQHFRIQSRQYRGADFKIVYWPQPQSPDVEQFYFPDLGIDLPRTVLYDELKTRIELESQVSGRGSARDYERRELAAPFLIRAVSANFAGDSRVTRGLGDQAFLFGNYLRLDGERLAELGLEHQVLITTSERAWEFGWTAGWLPDETLEGPGDADGDGQLDWLGKVPLAAFFEGQFPLPAEPFARPYPPPGLEEEEREAAAHEALAAAVERRSAIQPAPGRLIYIGGSEMFKDHRFRHAEFRTDHLLLNAVAELALPEELATLVGRRPVPRGFDFVEPELRMRWRTAVLVAWPLLLVLFGLVRALRRR